jgi:hypothetical protein
MGPCPECGEPTPTDGRPFLVHWVLVSPEAGTWRWHCGCAGTADVLRFQVWQTVVLEEKENRDA